jgi:hypothetical protein
LTVLLVRKKLARVRHLAFVARQTASFVRSVLGETSNIIWSNDDKNDGIERNPTDLLYAEH